MNRTDRALGILLLLRGGATLSATQLAQRFEVSTRTIYRDIETLASIGVPVYAEMGRAGGFRLMEGYFLPPVMFSVREATALLVGLTLLNRLRATPFAEELETARHKLLAAVPEHLQVVLAHTQQLIGFEAIPADVFHPERVESPVDEAQQPSDTSAAHEAQVLSIFLQALFDRSTLVFQYRSPYTRNDRRDVVVPQGLVWDRDRWYLVGKRADREEAPRLWRADRVLKIQPHTVSPDEQRLFDVRKVLGRRWLQVAMNRWVEEAPVVISLTREQADRLRQDWYYRYARFEEIDEQRVIMTLGESDRSVVVELLRWLGPGARLHEPKAWVATLRTQLLDMLADCEEITA